MAHGSVAVPYRWDQDFIPHGTGSGITLLGLVVVVIVDSFIVRDGQLPATSRAKAMAPS